MTKYNFKYLSNVLKEFSSIFSIFLSLVIKRHFFFLFFFSVIVIIFESYTLAIVYDVSNSILNKEFEINNSLLKLVLNYLGSKDPNSSLIILITLISFIFFKNIFLLFIIYFKNNFFRKMITKLSQNIFNKFMKQDYNFFLSRNSSELIANITNDVTVVLRGFDGIFNLLIETLLISVIFLYLIYIDTIIAIVFLLGGIAFFIFFTFFTKKKLLALSNERTYLNTNIIKDLQQSFSNFREIIIYASQKLFSDSINRKLKIYYSNITKTVILSQLSRVLIEQIFIILIVLIFLFINFFTTKNINDILPIFVVYLFAFMKVLPSLNKIIIETQTYLYSKLFIKKLNNYLNLKDKNLIKNVNFQSFNENLNFENVTFYYDRSDREILKNLKLTIKKNEKIGIVGKSGSGKTTILNLIMGFLVPKEGNIFLDNQNLKDFLINWQNLISYVPQNIALLDDTLKKNITFCENNKDIDFELLNSAINLSGLNEFIKNKSDGLNTILGEKGSKISGGEILRIGLARAFYSKAEVFILDEFTSALDEKTENEIIESINKIKKTFIIVSHKKNTLKHCDKIFELSEGNLTKIN